MKNILTLIAALVMLTGVASAQLIVSIPEVTPTAENSVLTIPVNVTNFTGVGAISLKISYDTSVLTFVEVPNSIGGNFTATASGGIIVIGWFSTSPLTVADGKLIDMKFQYKSGTSDLNFMTKYCEIADTSATSFTLTLNNGKVNASGGTEITKASVGDFVWADANKNGLQDSGENGLQWVTAELYNSAGVKQAWMVTDANGGYLFDSLDAGDYYVQFKLTGSYETTKVFASANSGSNDAVDSDVDPLTGKTHTFTLVNGECKTNIDAGICDKPEDTEPELVYSSIGNFVWNDANSNGVQDTGENGIVGVTVNLLNCSFEVLKSTTTDANGNYTIGNLTKGTYCVSFALPVGYKFTAKDVDGNDAVDSDPDAIHGRVDCFTLDSAQTLTTIDAGLCVVEETGSADIWIKKDDGITTMPDSAGTTTYTITYGNKGTAELFEAVINDTLPAGVKFISASGNGTESAGIVTFDLETLTAGEEGAVTVKVEVTSPESEYLNTAWLSGHDGKYILHVSAQDLNFADTTSCGCDGGVESRGDMAELLLRREWKIRNGLTTPVLSKSGAAGVASAISLKELVPSVGPYNSVPEETTPFDILGISNALSSYAVDYKLSTIDGSRRVGGVFSTITAAPKIYDHTKAVCDRLAGSAIEELKLVNVNGYNFYAAKLRKAGKITDYAISFSVYETPSGFAVENKWTWGEYDAPAGATSVYNFQAWSSSYAGTIELTKNIIQNLSTKGAVSYMMNNQASPEVFIKSTKYTHDGKIHLTLINNNAQSKEVSVTTYSRYSQGDELFENTSAYAAAPGESTIEIETGILADAQVSMSQSSGFLDEVFVSGGAFTYVTGSLSSITNFSTTGYPQQLLSNYPEGTIILAGGAAVSGVLNDWATVIRALSTNGTAYDLRSYGQLRFEAKGSGKLTVILDMANVSNYNYFAKTITLNSQNQEYVINFSEFAQLYGSEVSFDASGIRAVGFIMSTADNADITNFNYEVKNIGFYTQGATDVETDNSVPAEFALAQNFPNPFNPSTLIEFSVAAKEMISLKIYDMLGQEIANLVNEEMQPGRYSVMFDASHLSSGVYFYKLHGSSVNITKKMTLTK